MDAPESMAVPETASGAKFDLSVALLAPTADGTYTTSFSLQSTSGEVISIGTEKTFYVKVVVGKGSAGAENFQSSVLSPSHSFGTNGILIGSATIVCQYGYSENAANVQELASLINLARRDAGLSALSMNPLLTQAAQGHSIDMACNNFLGHQGSDGSPFGAMVRAVGYPTSFQEILAMGTPQNAMDQWAADPGHWEIVLNALATEMGVGYAYNPSSNYGDYFTIDLH